MHKFDLLLLSVCGLIFVGLGVDLASYLPSAVYLIPGGGATVIALGLFCLFGFVYCLYSQAQEEARGQHEQLMSLARATYHKVAQ